MGRQQFEQVVAQATRKKMKVVTQTGINIAAGNVYSYTLFSAPKTVGKIVNFKVLSAAPSGQATGYHSITVGHSPVGVSNVNLYYGSLTTLNAANEIRYGIFTNISPANCFPPTYDSQVQQSQNMQFDDTKGIIVYISNQTGVAINGCELCFVYMEEEVR